MKRLIAALLLFSISVLNADICTYLKPVKNKSEANKFENIDCVYLINVEKRIDRLQNALQQLEPYGIHACHFPAVSTHTLTLEGLNDLGVILSPEMTIGEPGLTYSLDEYDRPMPSRVNMDEFGKTYFNVNLIGMSYVLSHLSILQDAYTEGYNTIWVLEDGFEVIRDPRVLPSLINELDQTVGKGNWDILYTDRDFRDPKGKYMTCSCAPSPCRPNYQIKDTARFAVNAPVSNNLRKIGARFGTTSMIISRSGMKKILDFVTTRGVFLNIDQEIFLTENINLFTVREDIISNSIIPKKNRK